MTRRLLSAIVLAALVAGDAAYAQTAPDEQETALGAAFRREREHLASSCGSFSFKSISGCAIALATEQPVHVALGSIAPQNGFGFGAAFGTHATPNENWRIGLNADGVGALSGAWRTGAYLKIVRTAMNDIGVVRPGSGNGGDGGGIRQYPVVDVYAQAISLPKLFFFGVGEHSALSDRTVFGMRQTIVGTAATIPILSGLSALKPSLVGAVNGRFVDLRGNADESSPSIDTRFNDVTAPGLGEQPKFLQFGEGIRLLPSWFGGRLHPDYFFNFQQFLAASPDESAGQSFRRWTVDLNHEFPIYGRTRAAGATGANGPNECFVAVGSAVCPAVSRNRGGTVGFRVMASSATAFDGDVVPFYFQRTLGGSDINGNRALSAFEDYRFRGPNLLLLQESIEHSIWGPVGATFVAEQGKVTQRRGDLDFSNLEHSYAAGLTLRAGGFPAVYATYAWGSGEGHHVIFTMATTLLGGSSRPSLD